MKKLIFLGIGLLVTFLILSHNTVYERPNSWKKEEIIEYFKNNEEKFDNICASICSITYEGYVEFQKRPFDISTNVNTNQLSVEDIALVNDIKLLLKEVPVRKLTKTPNQHILFEFSNRSQGYYYFQGILYAEDFQQTQMEEAIDGNWFWYSIPVA